MFPYYSSPLQTDTSFGSDAKWGDWCKKPGVIREVPQLHSLLEESSGGRQQAGVVEDLQELCGKSRPRARWEIQSALWTAVLWWLSWCDPLKLCSLNEFSPSAGVEKVDIGLPRYRPRRTKEVRERMQMIKDNKKNVELERATRLRTRKLARTHCKRNLVFNGQAWKLVHFSLFSLYPPVKISLDRVQETWEKSSGPFQIKRLAEHYGVFRDLFPMAYFLPQVPLRICYSQDNSGQVHYGNQLTPTEVCSSFTVFSFCLVI